MEVQQLIQTVRKAVEERGRDEEDILRDLALSWGKDPGVDRALAESLGTIPSEKVSRLLSRMLGMTDDKRVQKAIRRSLYRLKSRGIPVAEPSVGWRESILRPPRTEPARGLGGRIDGQGQRFLLVGIPRPARGWAILQGLVSDSLGLIEFSGGEIGRKACRELLDAVQKEKPFPMVEMEASYSAFLLSGALRLTLERGGTPPAEALRFKKEMEEIQKEYGRPLIYAHLAAPPIAEDDRALIRAADLLDTDAFSDWQVEDDLIRPHAEAVREAGESRIVLTEMQKEARVQEIYQGAVFDLFSGERRSLYQRRLEEMAYYLLKTGKGEEAKISLAAGKGLEAPLNPFQPNPFLFRLVTRSIATVLARDAQEQKREPSFIVKP